MNSEGKVSSKYIIFFRDVCIFKCCYLLVVNILNILILIYLLIIIIRKFLRVIFCW